jgi:ribosomal protein L31
MSDTIVVSTKQNSFKFINEFQYSDKSYYIIHVKVEEKVYSNDKYYYDISYKYKFEGLETSKKIIHPFYNGKDEGLDNEGVIVYKNKMTEVMVEYLLADSEELEKESGSSTAQCYRTCIMLSLEKLWD